MGPEDGNFAIWVGTLVPNDSTYLVVSASGKDGETLQRMARIGYTKVSECVAEPKNKIVGGEKRTGG